MSKFNRETFDSTPDDYWRFFLSAYRTLRIRVPHAAPNHALTADCNRDGTWARRSSASCLTEGQSYGMSREDARAYLWDFAREIDWHIYLGSK